MYAAVSYCMAVNFLSYSTLVDEFKTTCDLNFHCAVEF